MNKEIYDYTQESLQAAITRVIEWCGFEDEPTEGFYCDGFDETGFSPEGLDEFGFDRNGKIWIERDFYNRSDFKKITTESSCTNYLYTDNGPGDITILLKKREITAYCEDIGGYRFYLDNLGTRSICFAEFCEHELMENALTDPEHIQWQWNDPPYEL